MKINIDDYDKFLPLGSVVLLKDSIKPLMIFGYLLTDINNKTKDYAGVPYPEGAISNDMIILFNHEDIKEMYFFGMYGEIFKKFERELKKAGK